MNLLRTFLLWISTAFRASPGLTVLMTVTTISSTVFAPLSVYGVKLFVDGVTGDGSAVLVGLVVICATLIITAVSGSIADPLGDTLDEKVFWYVHDDLLRLTAGIPSIAHHENREVADRIGLLERDAHQLGGIWRMLSIIGAVTGTATVMAMLASVSPWLILLMALAIGTAAIRAVGIGKSHAIRQRLSHRRRLWQLLTEKLTEAPTGLEVRCFGLSELLTRVGADAHRRQHQPYEDVRKRFAGYDAFGWLIYGAGYALAVVWVFTQVRAGTASLGDLTLVLLIGPQVNTTASTITANVATVMESLDSFGRYHWLRAYAADNTWSTSTLAPPETLQEGIRFDHVDFSYPAQLIDSNPDGHPIDPVVADGGDRALHDVDLLLPAGKTIAFVGDNGAGKSTLVKLLARLYDPTDGAVLIDGVPLTRIDPVLWRQRVSAGFQDFASLEFLASDTVGVGELGAREDRQLISTAVTSGQAEPVVDRLAAGLDTQLGVLFDGGAGLSGGQWQRLALSRAFMRTRPLLMLLDEPTAALDPEAEQAIYQEYGQTAKRLATETGAVTILVSHRFSTVRMADLIVVVGGGRVTELGSHSELIAAGGRYAELFDLQAGAYR